jgi:thiamine-phosphate pyrophosphorylase
LAGEGPDGLLRLPLLYGLTAERRGLGHEACAALLLEAGLRLVQLRDKRPAARDRLETARAVAALARARSALVVVNDRPDVALLSGADGVHLGEDDLPAQTVRALLGPAALVGVSTHAVDAARASMERPEPSYVALGPIFATSSKETPHAPLGLRAVARAARRKTKPLVVIGGILPSQVGECLAAGADSVAMIAGLLEGDPRKNVEIALASAARAGFA